MEGMGAVVKGAGSDCQKMGADLSVWVAANGEEIRTLSRQMSTLSEEENTALEVKFKPRVDAALEGFMAAGQCMATPEVTQALQAISPEPNASDDSAPKPTGEVSAEVRAKAERVVVIMEELGQTVSVAKGDCDVMGDTLTAFLSKNGQELDSLIAEMEAISPEVSEALDKEFDDRIMKAVGSFEALGQCMENPKVEAAMKKLPM